MMSVTIGSAGALRRKAADTVVEMVGRADGALVSGAVGMSGTVGMCGAPEAPDYAAYPLKWQKRFRLFDAHGGPASPGYRAALQQSLSRELIHINVWALLFGVVYLLCLGEWRKALTYTGGMAVLVLGLTLFGGPDMLSFALVQAGSVALALSVNYGFYLSRIRGEKSWNPFQGVFFWGEGRRREG